MQSCSEVVVRACKYYLCDVKPDGVTYIVNLISRVVKIYSAHTPAILEPLLPVVLRKLLEEEVWSLLNVADFPDVLPPSLPSLGPRPHHLCVPDPCGQTAGTLADLLLHTLGENMFAVTTDGKILCRPRVQLSIPTPSAVGAAVHSNPQ